MNNTDWRSWYEENQQGEFIVEAVDLDNMEGWSLHKVVVDDKEYLMFGPQSQGPYRVQGLRITNGERIHSQALLKRFPEELAFGYVALAVDVNSDRVILQAKKEPGYSAEMKYTAIAPPVQMSAYNYLQKHGGPKPPRSDWVDRAFMLPVPQDGGMLLHKYNHVGFLELEVDKVELLPSERIFTTEELKEALTASLCADHVLQALGMMKVFRR